MFTRVVLGIVVVIALTTHFTALDWGLRHIPEIEERFFVENTRLMLKARDLDHRFYEYPGLFFYLLAPVVAAVEPAHGSEHPAEDSVAAAPVYLAARVVVAAFGVLSVVLTFVLGRRLAGTRVGLAAAALLAVSPFEIETAHTVRPDVVLESFVLAALIAFTFLGNRLRHDALSGLALGAAAAVKFTGGLLVSVYLLARWTQPGPRLKGTALAALIAMVSWSVFTPYAVLKPQSFLSGTATQWHYHYRSEHVGARFAEILGYYAAHHMDGLGFAAAAAVPVGVAWTIASGRRRDWLPVIAWPIVLIGVLSTADMRYGRLALSASGAFALLAAWGIVRTMERWRGAVAVASLAALMAPARSSQLYLRELASPTPSDAVADWVHANVPPRATILCRLDWLGLDRRRFEVLHYTSERDAQLLGPYADYVVDGSRSPLFAQWSPLFTTSRPSSYNGDHIAIRRVPPAYRRRERTATLAGAQWTASSNSERAAAVADGRLDVFWTADTGTSFDWLQVDLRQPVMLSRVELLTGGRTHRAAHDIRLWVRDASGRWQQWPWLHARPPVDLQQRRRRSQMLVFDPISTSALRIEQSGRGRTRWAVAEVRLLSPLDPSYDQAAPNATAGREVVVAEVSMPHELPFTRHQGWRLTGPYRLRLPDISPGFSGATVE